MFDLKSSWILDPGKLDPSPFGRSPGVTIPMSLGHLHKMILAPWPLCGRKATANWADLREDGMINSAPFFWPMVGPLGPAADPGSLGTGCGSKKHRLHQKSVPETKYKARSWVLSVFGAGRKKIQR